MIWSELNLIEVADVFNGMTPSKIEQRIQGYPVLKIKDVSDNRKFRGVFESFVDIGLANKFKSKFIKLNDTLILNAAHNADYVGSKQYRAESEVVNSLPTGEWLIVRGDSNKVDSVYLNFWLRLDATRFKIRNLVKGIHLYPKDVARLKIPLPPLAEQQKIASILDAADSLRQKDQQLIEKYTALNQSLFLEMFGDPVINSMEWDINKIADLTETKTINGFFAKNEHYVEEGVPIVWITDFINKIYVNTQGLRKVNIKEDDISKYKLAYGDVLFCRSSLTVEGIGKCAIVPKSITQDVLFECHIIKVRLGNKVIPEYFRFLSNTSYFRSKIMKNAKTSTMTTISQEGITNIFIPVPPISIQNQFAERILAIEAQKQLAQASLEKSEALFNSLLQRAFKGEITV
jgi:type I restriction enzyme S subunit